MEDKSEEKINKTIEIDKNKYIVKSKIDEGTFGKVYVIEGKNDHKQYALKFLKKGDNPELELIHFQKEIKILKKLNDQKDNFYVPKIYCSGSVRLGVNKYESLAFVMDYAKNGDLFQYFINTDNGFKEKYAKYIFKRVVEGIKFCHTSSICHLDIKIDNILIDENYDPLITDFGYSEEFEDFEKKLKTFEGKKGTSEYMCPQMFEGENYSGIKADIFSLGVLLLALVLKKYGFMNSSEDDSMYEYIKNKQYSEFWDALCDEKKILSTELKDLYVKMVAYDLSERPTINEILADNWLKEINDMNETQMKKFIDKYIGYMTKLLSGNNENKTTVKQAEPEVIREKEGFDIGPKKGISTDKTYFNDDLEPKNHKILFISFIYINNIN